MSGGIRQHMRDTDKCSRFIHGHFPAVDIVSPHVAYMLFALKIVFGDTLHCDGGVFKMLGLSLLCPSVVGNYIYRNKSNDRNHYKNVYQDYPGSLQYPHRLST